MNCPEIREQLPLLTYGDLSADEKRRVEDHLAACAECRREYAALQGVRERLSKTAPPSLRVDVARVFRMSTDMAARKLRMWRRIAGAAAVVAICAFGLRFEVRAQAHQLILRWGPPPADVAAPAPAPRLPDAPDSALVSLQARDVDAELQLLSKLIHALADDVQEQDRQQRLKASELLARLKAVEQQSNRRYVAMEKDIETLFRLSQKGE